VRIGLYDLVDGRLVLRERIELGIQGERTEVQVPDADLVLINDDDLTYAKVRLDERSLATVSDSLSTLEDDLVRGLVWSSLWNATRDGELSAERYLDIVRRHAQAEPNVALLGAVLANAAFAVRHYVADEAREGQTRAWVDSTWASLQSADAGSDAQLAWARAFAAASAYDSGHKDAVRSILNGDTPQGLPVDADLRWLMLTALATTGDATAAEIGAERASDDTASGRTAEIRALASLPDAETRATAWKSAWNDRTLSNDHLSATIEGFRAGGRRDLIASFDDEYFSRIREAWRTRSIELAKRLVVGLFPDTTDTELVDAWLEQNEDAPGSLRRLVIEARDDLARDLRVRAAQPGLS
jgi:aminopeptidase N